MGSDLFIDYSCPFRKNGDTSHLHHLLRLKRNLDAIESGESPAHTVRIEVREGGTVREQVYTQADLTMASAKLSEVYSVCDACPANLKRAFGIRGTVGCHAHVHRPLDEFAERILHETLLENSREERSVTEQSNLVRAMLASTASDGKQWEAALARQHTPSHWGNHPVAVRIEPYAFTISVYALLEFLFMFPEFPLRAVEDVLSFFRSFFAVVGGYVSTPDGQLDQERNEQFWRGSAGLNELNLYIQLLKHASRLGLGVRVVSE
jgi:hypothetical protein